MEVIFETSGEFETVISEIRAANLSQSLRAAAVAMVKEIQDMPHGPDFKVDRGVFIKWKHGVTVQVSQHGGYSGDCNEPHEKVVHVTQLRYIPSTDTDTIKQMEEAGLIEEE